MLIAGLNLVVLSLIGFAWRDARESGGRPESVGAAMRCGLARAGYAKPASPLELKERAARVFEAERSREDGDSGILLALSVALRDNRFDNLERLLNEYECGRSL
jgi:hypothetical protein